MIEDETVKIRAGWSRSGKADLRPDQATELRELYVELQEVSAAGAHALGDIGIVAEGLALRRFLELQARASAIIERVRDILSY
jgi:hypothetical protein